MRLWSQQIQPFLPDMQFRGQLRELILILRAWKSKKEINHPIVGRVLRYPKSHLTNYFVRYEWEWNMRAGGKIRPLDEKHYKEFMEFDDGKCLEGKPYGDWLETEEHLRIEMANLYEKHLSIATSRITDLEWQRLLNGYKIITGKDYIL